MTGFEEEIILSIIAETPGLNRRAISALSGIKVDDLVILLIKLEIEDKIYAELYDLPEEGYHWFKYYVA